MNKFKQWIARVFNIQVEDLPEYAPKPVSTQKIDPVIREEIRRQVKEHIQESLQGLHLPETQKPSSEQTSHPLPQEPARENISSDISEAISIEKTPPGVPPTDIDDFLYLQSLSIEDEFPVIEDADLQTETTKTETKSPPQPERIEEIQEVEEFFDTNQMEVPDDPVIPAIEEEIAPLEEIAPPPVPEKQTQKLHAVSEQDIRLAIDFGTTTTTISIKIGESRPEALPIGLDGIKRYIPSMVYFKPGTGTLAERAVVGEEAESFGDQAQIIRSVKRCFGCQGRKCNNDDKHNVRTSTYPFPLCHGDGKIHISETETILPSEIAYLIIKEAIKRAVKIVRDRMQIDLTQENICVLPLNLGCGAQFNFEQRLIITTIAKDLGFKNIKIDNVVEEPILAGFTFSRFAQKPEGRALIYDFGGGTFDVAILDVDRPQQNLRVTVIATAGENWLGGDDIDNLVYEYFLKDAAKELGFPVGEMKELLGNIDNSKLHNIARKAKEQLSEINLFSDVLLAQGFEPINLELSREKFEALLEESGYIEKSLEAVERACKLAYAFENAKKGYLIDAKEIVGHRINDAAPEIDRVILVGGVTKTPYIRNKLIEIFGAEKIVEETIIEPISAVAIGGAYPRDPQHYSLNVPPYRFYLEYQTSNDGEKHTETIFEPYEYYDYHRFWMSSSRPAYFKDINLLDDMNNVRLISVRAGENAPSWQKSLGMITPGDWRFSISLEGDISYSKKDGAPIKIDDYPILHPIQQAIRAARESKMNEEKLKTAQSQGDYDDWVLSMMTDS